MGQKRMSEARPLKIVRVVIDTNVIVSALLFGGTPGELISLWKNNLIRPLVSKKIIGEYIKVLSYPKFKLTENEIHYLIYSEILPFFDVIPSGSKERIVPDDPTDDKFIECAVSGKADYVISGDRHLLSLVICNDIKMVDPSQFIKILLGCPES
jgi:putative PIN family toxin of toxin-antitoxin system